jgi:hypothetical protein
MPRCGVSRRVSPTKAGLVTVLAMCVIGIVVAVVAASSEPASAADHGARARRYGSHAGIVAALAGAAAYLGQAWRGKR